MPSFALCSIRFAFCLFSFMLLGGVASAQSQTTRELLREARAYIGKDTNLALLKIEEMLSISEEGSAWQDSAYLLMQEYYKEAPNSLHPYNEKSEAFQQLETYYREQADTASLAKLYLQWVDLDQEVDLGTGEVHVSQASTLFEAIGDTLGLIDCQFRMGVLQGSMGNPQLVPQHFEEALALSKAVKDTAYITEAHTRLAELYMRKGQAPKALEQVELALAGASKARPSTLINTYRIQGYLYSFEGRFEEAFQQLERSMELARSTNDMVRLAMLQLDMGQIHYSSTQNDALAIKWLNKGAATAAESGSLRFQKSAARGLSLVHEQAGHPDKALSYFQQFYQLENQIQNEKDRQQLLHLQAKYENEKQAKELARQEAEITAQQSRQRLLTLFLIGLGLLAVLIAVAYYQQRKSRQELAAQKAIIETQAGELRELDAAKSRLFANISHELRTPLTLMLAPVSSLHKRLPEEAAERPFLNMIRQNGEQLLRRVNEILDLSKLDAGKLELEEDAVAIDAFVRRQVSMFESYAHQQQVDLDYESSLEAEQALLTDEDKLGKIVTNLLSNALKFTPAGGSVLVEAEREDSQLKITVADTGRGIPAEELEHIFERFYQSKQRDVPLEGGTGIGLAFCKELAAVLGGSLEAESQVGKGSTFILRVPYQAASIAAPEDEKLYSTRPGAAEGSVLTKPSSSSDETLQGRLLIVEDNQALREYLEAILSPAYRVHCVKNGREALSWLEQNGAGALDLIISDVMMPEMDGFTLLEKLKEDNRYKFLPIIMLTALARRESRLRALRIGVDDYLLKPFEEEELLARIQSLLRNYQLRSEEPDAAEGAEQAAEQEALGDRPESEEELEWLAKMERITLERLGDTNFKVGDLADDLSVSTRQLFRRVKQLTGLTPNQYLQEARLEAARRMLEQKRFSSVKSVAYEVGFKDTRYFSRQYKARFGRLPSGYL